MYKRILTAVTAIVLLCLPTAWAADTSATAAILMDGDTGEVLYEKNPDRQMLIASTTKLMTALVVLERGGSPSRGADRCPVGLPFFDALTFESHQFIKMPCCISKMSPVAVKNSLSEETCFSNFLN